MGIINDSLVVIMSLVYGLILIIGYTVYQNNKERPAHRYFYFLSVVFVLWLVVNSLQLVTSNEVAIFFNYADHAVAPWVAYALLLFLMHVPHYRNVLNSLVRIGLFIPIAICSIMVVSNQVIHSVVYNGSYTVSQYGAWYGLYSYILLAYVLAGLFVLVVHMIRALPSERRQLLFVFASAVAVFGSLFVINLLFGYYIDNVVQLILNNLALVWLVVVSIAIRQYLFNIKTFSRTLVHVSLMTLIAVGVFALYEFINLQTQNLIKNDLAVRILFIVVTIPIMMSTYRFCQKTIERVFKPKQTVAARINQDLQNINLNKETTLRDITKIIDNTVYDLLGTYPSWHLEASPAWRTITNHLTMSEHSINFDELIRALNHPTEPLIKSNLLKESVPGGKKSHLVELMDRNGIELIYPISHEAEGGEQRIFGFMFISNESPFLGKNETSYISMMLPQVKEKIYDLNQQENSTLQPTGAQV